MATSSGRSWGFCTATGEGARPSCKWSRAGLPLQAASPVLSTCTHACRRAGQAGPVTRLMSCTEEELKTYRGLDLMPTFVAPSFKYDPEHGDTYAAYNKPGAIMAWLEVTCACQSSVQQCHGVLGS